MTRDAQPVRPGPILSRLINQCFPDVKDHRIGYHGIYLSQVGRSWDRPPALLPRPLASLDAQYLEPFPSWLCFAELQYVDDLGELTGAPGAAAEFG
jgi:hypothetical protein